MSKPAYANKPWYQALTAEITRHGRRAVVDRLRISDTTVSQLLSGKYPSDPSRMIARIEGELLNKTVRCPVLGEISVRACQDNQDRPFANTNPQRVALYRACRSGCKHSKHTGLNHAKR